MLKDKMKETMKKGIVLTRRHKHLLIHLGLSLTVAPLSIMLYNKILKPKYGTIEWILDEETNDVFAKVWYEDRFGKWHKVMRIKYSEDCHELDKLKEEFGHIAKVLLD